MRRAVSHRGRVLLLEAPGGGSEEGRRAGGAQCRGGRAPGRGGAGGPDLDIGGVWLRHAALRAGPSFQAGIPSSAASASAPLPRDAVPTLPSVRIPRASALVI